MTIEDQKQDDNTITTTTKTTTNNDTNNNNNLKNLNGFNLNGDHHQQQHSHRHNDLIHDPFYINNNNDHYLHIQDKTAKFQQELIHEINDRSDKFRKEIENLLSKTNKYEHINKLNDVNAANGHLAANGNCITSNGANNATLSKIDSSHHKKKGDVPQEKHFQSRESLLTELFKVTHIRTLRHIFISILVIILFQVIIYDLTNKGAVDLDFELFRWCFDGFIQTLTQIWLYMQLTTLFTVYYGLYIWSYLRIVISNSISPKYDFIKRIYDYLWIIGYVLYQVAFIFYPLKAIYNVQIACRLIILLEQVRLLMKTHAFIRQNIPECIYKNKYIHEKAANDDTSPNEKKMYFPKFSKYVYFLFAPTLVYRDEYPRTMKVRWGLVLVYFVEVIGCMIYTYVLFDRFCVPLFRDLKISQLTIKNYIYLISICVMPGALIQFMTFFAFLHSWHNAWAEMLRFGDRQFYLDWWNSTSYNKYYRTWNTLVQDWLHTYIYRDLYKIFGGRYRALSQFGVIFISSLFHEHILSFAFGFFYPVMFFLFSGFGFVCLFIPRSNNAAWNVFIWTTLFTGIGIQICLFSLEWYARNTSQCPQTIPSIVDYFIPRSLICK